MQEERSELNLKPSPREETSSEPVPQRVRHVYLEEENVYGRFVPFLLLKDKLHSQIDSTGTSALVHMCSHNSSYLPLYLSTLKHGDPILNRPTNMGHTPLDVAGMYCRRQYVDLLKEKGAIDDGKVDCWAIQGGNIANWSGKVDPSKKPLIHWAAYNNLPQVLEEFYKAGADVDEPDEKGHTPIDMALINKSYESVEVLAKLGFRPKKTLLDNCQSPYLTHLFKELDRPSWSIFLEKSLKLSFVPLLLLSQFLILGGDASLWLILSAFLAQAVLVSVIPGKDSQQRPTAFFSELINQSVVYGYNHFLYLLFMLLLILNCLITLVKLDADSLWLGFYFWMTVFIVLTLTVNLWVLVYGVFTNTTPAQLYQSHKHKHLWKKIEYLPHKNIVFRTYKNQHCKSKIQNLKAYFAYKRP